MHMIAVIGSTFCAVNEKRVLLATFTGRNVVIVLADGTRSRIPTAIVFLDYDGYVYETEVGVLRNLRRNRG